LKQKISILGCGWLGLPLAKALRTNYQVLGSSTNTDTLKELSKIGVQPFLVTLKQLESDTLRSFLQADVLIITVPPKSADFVKRIENIIEKISNKFHQNRTFEVLNLDIENQDSNSLDYRPKIKKVIYCSSISVYGNQTGVITEKTLVKPETENAKKMVDVEQMLLQNSAFETTILRFGGLIGENRHPAKHLSNKTLKHPNTPVNLIHLTDCIGVIDTVLTQNLIGIYNIVTPHHPSKNEYYTAICKQLKIPLPKINTSTNSQNKLISSKKINEYYHFKNEKLRL